MKKLAPPKKKLKWRPCAPIFVKPSDRLSLAPFCQEGGVAPTFAVTKFNGEGCTIIFDLISFKAQRSDEGRPFSKPKAF